MGHKSVCIDCRKSLNIKLESDAKRLYLCSECNKQMIILSHRFRPPKKTDDKKWETVKYLIENGFYYRHIYKKIEAINGVTCYERYVDYPENIKDAKEFVAKYKSQMREMN